jgi:hypothetical protein
MPVLSEGSLKIDHTDDRQGQPVVLIQCQSTMARAHPGAERPLPSPGDQPLRLPKNDGLAGHLFAIPLRASHKQFCPSGRVVHHVAKSAQ